MTDKLQALDYRGRRSAAAESPAFRPRLKAWAQIFALAILYTIIAIAAVTALLIALSHAAHLALM